MLTTCRRVIRPWLGLKMIDLNEMIIAQLKERDAKFPKVDRGVLVPMVYTLNNRFMHDLQGYFVYHVLYKFHT